MWTHIYDIKDVIVNDISQIYTTQGVQLSVTELIHEYVGRDSIPVRRPDSQSREPGFKSHCGRFEPLASLITSQFTQMYK